MRGFVVSGFTYSIGGQHQMTAPESDQQKTDAPSGKSESKPEGKSDAAITQEQMNKLLAAQKRDIESQFSGFDDIKAKAEQFDALTETAKSDMQRLQEQLQSTTAAFEAEKAEKSTLATQLMRSKISASKGLDADLWDRVTGATEEDITADVEKLVAKFQPPSRVSLGSRSGSGASAPDGKDPKERAAAAVRGLRAGI
jgi:hypothetical protein